MWCKIVVWVHQHTQIYYVTTSVTYMLVQSRGFGGTNLYQTIINNESHKYVCGAKGNLAHHILQKYIIELSMLL
jgi:predicted ATPase